VGKTIVAKGEPPLLIGHGSEKDEYITESERESHLHIIGAPGEGKSKFLEHLMRHDIDRLKKKDPRACGFCFIDPSDQGNTAYKVLAYCAKVKFKKVLLIDPFRFRTHRKVVPLNPFNYHESQIDDSVAMMMDTFRVLFNVKDPGDTNIIETYLPALLSILHHGGFTIHDALYFTNYDSFDYYRHREFILDKAYKITRAKKDVIDIESALKNEKRFEEFRSTVRRLNPIFRSHTLDLMLSHKRGMDFTKLIADGWIILVNVSTDEGLDVLQARLLATVVINQIISGMERLRRGSLSGVKYNKPYYLYIDEAGEFATRKVARVLELKRQAGLRFTLAHQFPGQFEDKRVRQSVESMTKLKAAFYIADARERAEVIKLLNYGGEITDRQIIYALSDQKKQNMVWRANKAKPHIIQVPHTPDAKSDIKTYLDTLLASPWYLTEEEILKDNAERFKGLPEQNTKSPQPAKKTQRKTTRKAAVPGRVQGRPKEDLPPDNEAGRADEKRKPIDI